MAFSASFHWIYLSYGVFKDLPMNIKFFFFDITEA